MARMCREKVVVYGIHLLARMVAEAPSSNRQQWWQSSASSQLLLVQTEAVGGAEAWLLTGGNRSVFSRTAFTMQMGVDLGLVLWALWKIRELSNILSWSCSYCLKLQSPAKNVDLAIWWPWWELMRSPKEYVTCEQLIEKKPEKVFCYFSTKSRIKNRSRMT